MKNKVYVNKNNKVFNNNQKSFSINELDKKEVIINKDNLSVSDKINKILNRNGYAFNLVVDIITNNHKYHTSIANKMGNNIITMDGDVINIKDIEDIIIN